MKKIPFINSLLAFAVGLLFILTAIDLFAVGQGYIALGIFGLIAGACCIVYGVFKIVFAKKEKDPAPFLNETLLVSLFMLYYFVGTLLNIIYGYNNYTPSNWVISLAILTVTLCGSLLGIMSMVNKNEALATIRTICCGAFIALFIVSIAVGFYGDGTTGGILLSDIVFILSFTYFAIATVNFAKPEEKKVEPEPVKDDIHEEESTVLTDKLDIN